MARLSLRHASYCGRHVVKGMALYLSYRAIVVVAGPGSQQEQLPCSTGVKSLSARLGKWSKAVLQQNNGRVAIVIGRSHDLLLTRTDGRRYQNHTNYGFVSLILFTYS